jgi:YD repeat-containing protein
VTVTDPQYTETQTYGYDALSRLTSAAATGGPASYSATTVVLQFFPLIPADGGLFQYSNEQSCTNFTLMWVWKCQPQLSTHQEFMFTPGVRFVEAELLKRVDQILSGNWAN